MLGLLGQLHTFVVTLTTLYVAGSAGCRPSTPQRRDALGTLGTPCTRYGRDARRGARCTTPWAGFFCGSVKGAQVSEKNYPDFPEYRKGVLGAPLQRATTAQDER